MTRRLERARRWRRWCAGALIAGASTWSGAAPSLPERPFVYSTREGSVADVLDALGRATHVPVRIEGDVKGRLAGRYDLMPAQMLDLLGASFGFIWYYDGAVIHVAPARERASLVVQLNYASAQATAARIEQQGIVDAREPLHVDAAANRIRVSGAPAYTARIADAIAQREARARAQVPTVVRTVPLQLASAADRTFAAGGRMLTTPGLATRLRERLRGKAAQPAPLEFEPPLPVFEADAATNAILVRDRATRIDDDIALIERFDTKPDAVAIRTYVFDVDADVFDQLGLAAATGEAGGAQAWQPAEQVEHDGGAALMARLAVLERSGGANMRITRELVTVDRLPAGVECRTPKLLRVDAAGRTHTGEAASRGPTDEPSILVEPDLGSDTTVRLVTTVSDRCGSGDTAPDAAWAPVDAVLAAGDALVLTDPPARAARSPGSRRVVVVVPKLIG